MDENSVPATPVVEETEVATPAEVVEATEEAVAEEVAPEEATA